MYCTRYVVSKSGLITHCLWGLLVREPSHSLCFPRLQGARRVAPRPLRASPSDCAAPSACSRTEHSLRRATKPRNPRNFHKIEGGRKRVSDTFIDKKIQKECFMALEEHNHCSQHFFWRQNTVSDSGTLWGPALNKTALRAHKVRSRRNPKYENMEIGEFGVGRTDFGGR